MIRSGALALCLAAMAAGCASPPYLLDLHAADTPGVWLIGRVDRSGPLDPRDYEISFTSIDGRRHAGPGDAAPKAVALDAGEFEVVARCRWQAFNSPLASSEQTFRLKLEPGQIAIFRSELKREFLMLSGDCTLSYALSERTSLPAAASLGSTLARASARRAE